MSARAVRAVLSAFEPELVSGQLREVPDLTRSTRYVTSVVLVAETFVLFAGMDFRESSVTCLPRELWTKTEEDARPVSTERLLEFLEVEQQPIAYTPSDPQWELRQRARVLRRNWARVQAFFAEELALHHWRALMTPTRGNWHGPSGDAGHRRDP